MCTSPVSDRVIYRVHISYWEAWAGPKTLGIFCAAWHLNRLVTWYRKKWFNRTKSRIYNENFQFDKNLTKGFQSDYTEMEGESFWSKINFFNRSEKLGNVSCRLSRHLKRIGIGRSNFSTKSRNYNENFHRQVFDNANKFLLCFS